jgi:hypothetical protein
MKRIGRAVLCACVACGIMVAVFSCPTPAREASKKTPSERGHKVDKPGTITFTEGLSVKSKVEKPQMMIFLYKEKPVYRKEEASMSFLRDIMKPLPFTPAEP